MAAQVDDREEWLVHQPGEWENEITEHTHAMDAWFAVSNTDGIKAYFGEEEDAFAFARLKANSPAA